MVSLEIASFQIYVPVSISVDLFSHKTGTIVTALVHTLESFAAWSVDAAKFNSRDYL